MGFIREVLQCSRASGSILLTAIEAVCSAPDLAILALLLYSVGSCKVLNPLPSKRANDHFQHLYLSPIFPHHHYAHVKPNTLKSNEPSPAHVPLPHLPSPLLRAPLIFLHCYYAHAEPNALKSNGPFPALVPLLHLPSLLLRLTLSQIHSQKEQWAIFLVLVPLPPSSLTHYYVRAEPNPLLKIAKNYFSACTSPPSSFTITMPTLSQTAPALKKNKGPFSRHSTDTLRQTQQ
ncbi:hypothetical protein F5876DRAFT_81844 [Lentinula aff. lateritia]|uniref:Uncharacterized protein n=1 Tax=Lentinula aff. lateritia TaxID=2804960 RepID=A0ACC1TLB3_9AGAR|nr:hypothetical protein F5876DRAFT_81844 [Lentinula aff. lateritia]